MSIELAAAVNLLTRDSKHRVADADGRLRFVTVSPLLVQLKLAIANSTAAGADFVGFYAAGTISRAFANPGRSVKPMRSSGK